MKELHYSQDSKEKLKELRKHLDFQFGNEVRKRVLKELDKRIKMLRSHEDMGISVRENYGVDCDYLCIYAAKNYVFYTVLGNSIHIVNMYHEKEDFMREMFGIRTTMQKTENYREE